MNVLYINKLVDFLISEKAEDFSFQKCFLLMYKTFMKPEALLVALFHRYNYIYPVLPRLLRMCSILRTWLDIHFDDFNKEMIWVLKVFIRSKLKYDTKSIVAQNLANTLERKLHPRQINKHTSILPPPPKIQSLPSNSAWDDIPEEEFARQICLLDFAALRAIKTSEFFDLNWLGADSGRLAPNLCSMINRWNKMCNWVTTALVSVDKIRERVKAFSRLIRIAQHLRDMNNFHGLMAIMLGLHSGAISRLKFTQEEIPKKEKKS